MPGQGRYDDLCRRVREEAAARLAIVIICDGRAGHGVSIDGETWEVQKLPDTLRWLADAVETDLKGMGV